MNDEINVHIVDKGRKFLYMRYRCPLTGQDKTRSTKTGLKRDAERAAAKWESELREGRYRVQSRMTWAEFREKYETEVLSGLAKGTKENRFTIFNHLERLMNPQRLSDLTTPRLSAFVGTLREEGMLEPTLSGYLAHLKPVLGWAVTQGYLRVMPAIPKTKRAKGITKTMRGRPITGEEFDRMIEKIPEKRKRDPEKWQQLLNGLWLSGLRLEEALALSWDEGTAVSVSMTGKYPTLRILAEGEKGHQDRVLPIAPDFATFLKSVPESERKGLVFGIYGIGRKPLSTKRAGRYISMFGEAARVVVNIAEGKFATAHDLRRAFGTRWASKVMPAVLQRLMRHDTIRTTMAYYVDLDTEEVGDLLRRGKGDSFGDNPQWCQNRLPLKVTEEALR